MSERNDSKVKHLINKEYKEKPNVLVINYDRLLETENNNLNNIIDYVFNEFNNFIPRELKPKKEDALIKEDMKKRVIWVNKVVEYMKYISFDKVDRITGIHGSHRNRK